MFCSKKYMRIPKYNGLKGSMGRVGSSGDNAAVESFFSLLQKNILDTRRWDTREDHRRQETDQLLGPSFSLSSLAAVRRTDKCFSITGPNGVSSSRNVVRSPKGSCITCQLRRK